MQLQITFHGMRPSEALAATIRGRAEKLAQLCGSIVSCRVTVGKPHRHQTAGRRYVARVEVGVPGQKLFAAKDPGAHPAYVDPHLAVREAFDAVGRQLEDYEARRRGNVKAHS